MNVDPSHHRHCFHYHHHLTKIPSYATVPLLSGDLRLFLSHWGGILEPGIRVKAVILKVWSPYKQRQHHLINCIKNTSFQAPSQDLFDWKFGVGSINLCLTSSASDLGVC